WDCVCGRCQFGAPPPLPGLVRAPSRQRCTAVAPPACVSRAVPFDALLARMAAVSFFAAATWPLRFSERTAPIKHIRCGFANRVAVILGCMEFSRPPLVVAFELSEKRKAIVADALARASDVV